LCTPYETREPWKIAATLYKGTIYLNEIETSEGYDRRKNMEEKHKEMCYWGHKFETYVCSLVSERQKKRSEASSTLDGALSEAATASTSEDSRKDPPCNNCEGFISVVRTRLEKHSLVFGAEVDCCTRVSSFYYIYLYIVLQVLIISPFHVMKLN
jgi:RAT1-interacting protein